MACQTMSRVMIPKVEMPVSNHEWFSHEPKIPRLLRAQLTTPSLLSNSHWNTTLPVRAGIAQARTIAADRIIRGTRAIRSSSSATSVPRTTVSATLTIMKMNVRIVTEMNCLSARIAAKLSRPTHVVAPLMSSLSPMCWRLISMTSSTG
jgi:hypothetical protein